MIDGLISVGKYHDYRVWVPAEMKCISLRIKLKANKGDSDLYVGNGKCPRPRRPPHEHTVSLCACACVLVSLARACDARSDSAHDLNPKLQTLRLVCCIHVV